MKFSLRRRLLTPSIPGSVLVSASSVVENRGGDSEASLTKKRNSSLFVSLALHLDDLRGSRHLGWRDESGAAVCGQKAGIP